MKDTKMNLNDMTAPELRKLAAQFKIAGRSTMKKADLVAALSAPERADIVELRISLNETAEILADEDAVAAIEESDAETMDDLRAVLANAEADAECDRARRLAEYDAEEADRRQATDHNPDTDGLPSAIDFTSSKTAPVKVDNRVRIDITRYDQGRADARMNDRQGFEYWAAVYRQFGKWVLVDREGPKEIKVKAGSLEKLAKRWAKKLGVWANDIRITKED